MMFVLLRIEWLNGQLTSGARLPNKWSDRNIVR